MRTRDYILLFAIGLILLIGVATQEGVPGYMDADYYYATGLRIAKTGSWDEPFLWNYLNEPEEIPHPAFTYWMPMAGVISALGITLSGLQSFWGAKLGFILIASFLSPLTAYSAFTVTPSRWAGFLAGTLAIISGFYFVYLPATETFGIYMILGCTLFLLLMRLQVDIQEVAPLIAAGSTIVKRFVPYALASPFWIYILLGANVGLMYLTRADGIIWLGMALAAILFQGYGLEKERADHRGPLHYILFPICLALVGFLIICSPWFMRNILSFGSIFAPGLTKTLWLTDYDELYTFPASVLTFERWLKSGLIDILRVRGWALGLNSLTAFAVQGSIFLTPLIVVGMWIKRKDWRVSIGALGWLVTLLVMTFIFPFQGARGGFFHAGAGFQPMFWALVPVGLLGVINWVAGFRNWEVERAIKLFSVGVIGLSIALTIFVSWRRLSDEDPSALYWGKSELAYQEIEAYLNNLDISHEDVVMVNNPPGYYAMTGREAIVIPDGDLNTSLLTAEKYKASYLILDENYPQGLSEMYHYPRDVPGVSYMGTVEEMQIYLIDQ